MLLELVAERSKDVLAALGVEQFNLTGKDVDVLVGLTRLAAAALVNLDDKDSRVDALDGTHALDNAGTAHVGLHLDAIAQHIGQLLVDVVDVIDFHLFHEQGLQKVQFKKGIIPLR